MTGIPSATKQPIGIDRPTPSAAGNISDFATAAASHAHKRDIGIGDTQHCTDGLSTQSVDKPVRKLPATGLAAWYVNDLQQVVNP